MDSEGLIQMAATGPAAILSDEADPAVSNARLQGAIPRSAGQGRPGLERMPERAQEPHLGYRADVSPLHQRVHPDRWNEPFSNSYVNITHGEIRLRTPIDEIVQRIAAIAKTAILENDGRMELRDGEVV